MVINRLSRPFPGGVTSSAAPLTLIKFARIGVANGPEYA